MPERRSHRPSAQAGNRHADLDAELRALSPELDRWVVAEPGAELVDATLRQARALLADPVPAPTHATIPSGFKRELAKLLAAAVPPLIVVLAWNAFVLLRAPEWLERWLPAWLPDSLAWALPAAYALGALGWLALVFGSLPVFAHRRAWLRTHEALS